MNAEAMKKEFEKQIQQMAPIVLEYPWDNPEFYQNWLAQTYFIVRHTSHFICMSAAIVPVENRAEHYHMIEHLKEEENHDLLLKSDLDFFDRSITEFSELPQTSLVWQNLYYWLSIRKPRSILGHSLCIEGLAGYIGKDLTQKLNKFYPSQACQFLEVHFEADKKHFEQGLELIQKFPQEDISDIFLVQKQSMILYLNMMEKIKHLATQASPKKRVVA